MGAGRPVEIGACLISLVAWQPDGPSIGGQSSSTGGPCNGIALLQPERPIKG